MVGEQISPTAINGGIPPKIKNFSGTGHGIPEFPNFILYTANDR